MPIVIGVRFKDSGKIYHFDPGDVPLAVGDWAIVETARGPELGRIAAAPVDLPPAELLGEIKPVLRRAAQADMDNLAHLQQYLDEALAICAERVVEHKLPMQLVKAEYNFDGSRLTFFFTSDKRVDFRGLVRDLARTFHTRIELRQVGPRDEAKLLGGIGPCGRPLCCSTFLPDFARVSIKMAKDQDLPLNPVKISGVCGRLLCCLSYEHEQYLDIKAELPARGAWVQTPEGPGEVIAVNVVRETVTVELTNGNTIDCTAAQIDEVSERVGAEARSRNEAGVTPVAQMRLASELESEVDPDTLGALEDRPPAPAPLSLEAALTPTAERPAPRAPRPDPRGQRRDERPDGRIADHAAGDQRRNEPRMGPAAIRPNGPPSHPDAPDDAGGAHSANGANRRRRRGRGDLK